MPPGRLPDVTVVPVPSRARPSVGTVAGVAAFAAIAVAGLTWAKWWPYAGRLVTVAHDHVYPGSSILGAPGSAPSWHGALQFALAYGTSVWPALVVALAVGAAAEALLPRRWLLRALDRPGAAGSVRGGLLALPSLMCTCCAAPVTAALRRCGVPTGAALAWWLGNPVLNPAVLAFLALVLPWPYAATRLAVGLLLVVGLTPWLGRLAPRDRTVPRADDLPGWPEAAAAGEPAGAAAGSARFLRALARLTVTLVPEYAVVVLAVGALRGELLPLGGAHGWGVTAVVVAALAGTLLVIPTAAEIPVITGLLAVGAGGGVTGALLLALPAVSLPSLVMLGRSLSWRVTAATAAAVAACALLAGGLVAVLA